MSIGYDNSKMMKHISFTHLLIYLLIYSPSLPSLSKLKYTPIHSTCDKNFSSTASSDIEFDALSLNILHFRQNIGQIRI